MRCLLLAVLVACSKGPVASITVDNVPAETGVLAVLAQLEGQSAQVRTPERAFHLRLPAVRGLLTVEITAEDSQGCALARGRATAEVGEGHQTPVPVTLGASTGCMPGTADGGTDAASDGGSDLSPAGTRWPASMEPSYVLASGLGQPQDVCWSGGRLYVSDAERHNVAVFTSGLMKPESTPQHFLGQPSTDMRAAGAAALLAPSGLWCDENILLVADTQNHRVLLFERTDAGSAATGVVGQQTYEAGGPNRGRGATMPEANTLHAPAGVFWDKAGRFLYIADRGNNRVVAYAAAAVEDLRLLRGFGAQPPPFGQKDFLTNPEQYPQSGLSGPTGVFVDRGRVAVADGNNHRVVIYRGDRTQEAWIGQDSAMGNSTAELSTPQQVRVFEGQTYVVDQGHDRVLVYDQVLPDAGAPRPKPMAILGGLRRPTGAYLVRDGGRPLLVVADRLNSRVVVYRP